MNEVNKALEAGNNKDFISVAELASLLKISRIAVYKRIKKGKIPATKVGRSYVVSRAVIDEIVHGTVAKILTEEKKEVIEKAVEKTVKEYGETLRLLGKE